MVCSLQMSHTEESKMWSKIISMCSQSIIKKHGRNLIQGTFHGKETATRSSKCQFQNFGSQEVPHIRVPNKAVVPPWEIPPCSRAWGQQLSVAWEGQAGQCDTEHGVQWRGLGDSLTLSEGWTISIMVGSVAAGRPWSSICKLPFDPQAWVRERELDWFWFGSLKAQSPPSLFSNKTVPPSSS